MAKQHQPASGDDNPNHEARWRQSAGAIGPTITGVTAGATVGWITRDLGLGVTTAVAVVSILRDVFPRPRQ